MYTTITIGEKEQGMLANAASPILYKILFKEDLLQKIQKLDAAAPDMELIQRMAFLFSMQAEKKKTEELRRLSEDDFISWLEQFEPLELIEHGNDIISLYVSNTKSTSIPKEKGE